MYKRALNVFDPDVKSFPLPLTRLAAACLLLWLPWSAQADEAADLRSLDAIYRTARRDNAQALKDAQIFSAGLGSATSYAVRAESLQTLIPLLLDAGQTHSADALIAELRQIATAQADLAGMALASVWAADQHTEADHPDQALPLLLQAKELTQRSASPVALLAWHRSMGHVYDRLGNFQKALEHQLMAMRLAEQQPRRQTQAKLQQFHRLAGLYSDMKEPQRALDTVHEALKLEAEAGDAGARVRLQSLLGSILGDMGQSRQALAAYEEALALARAAGMVESEIVVLINLADHHLRAHNYERAATFARQAMERLGPAGNRSSMAVARANLGFALAGQGQVREGVGHVNAAVQSYHDAGARTDEEGLHAELSAMYEKAGLWREALASARQQTRLSREIFQADQVKAISVLQEQFNAEQRQKQIELLARDNLLKDRDLANQQLRQTVTLLATLVTLMAAAFSFYLYRRSRKLNRQLNEVNNQLVFHAVRDPLTGLYNRRAFLDRMQHRSAPTDAGEIHDGLLIFDVDHFKLINDSRGHACGDAVLMEMAQRLRSAVRESDMVVRWGGEEFLIYSPRASLADMHGLAQRLLHSIGAEPVRVANESVPVTFTAGFITLPYSGIPETVCDWEKALHIADKAMYLGKVDGRNRAYGVGPLRVAADEALPLLSHNLSAALKAGMLELIEVLGPVQARVEP
jgi:diguanylate cyclase (GGDEF)-like protein